MLTKEKYDEILATMTELKAWIWEQPTNWAGDTNPPFNSSSPRNIGRWNTHKLTWREHKKLCDCHTQLKRCKERDICNCGLSLLQRRICRWFILNDILITDQAQNPIAHPQEKHSKAWNIMKRNEALDKWKRTPKIKRGQDPRTLPFESFV